MPTLSTFSSQPSAQSPTPKAPSENTSENESGAYLHASRPVHGSADLAECLTRDVRTRNVRINWEETGRWQRVVHGTIGPDGIVEQVEHAHPEREPGFLTKRHVLGQRGVDVEVVSAIQEDELSELARLGRDLKIGGIRAAVGSNQLRVEKVPVEARALADPDHVLDVVDGNARCEDNA